MALRENFSRDNSVVNSTNKTWHIAKLAIDNLRKVPIFSTFRKN